MVREQGAAGVLFLVFPERDREEKRGGIFLDSVLISMNKETIREETPAWMF